jgi:hypothetical protein
MISNAAAVADMRRLALPVARLPSLRTTASATDEALGWKRRTPPNQQVLHARRERR